jgi:hypothetical protein
MFSAWLAGHGSLPPGDRNRGRMSQPRSRSQLSLDLWRQYRSCYGMMVLFVPRSRAWKVASKSSPLPAAVQRSTVQWSVPHHRAKG